MSAPLRSIPPDDRAPAAPPLVAAPVVAARPVPASAGGLVARLGGYAPGLALCVAVTLAAMGIERVEAAVTGRAWIESIVLAILVGTAVRTAWTPSARWNAGIKLSAKQLLEVAVVLMGLSLDLNLVLRAGPILLPGIALAVAAAIAAGYALARLLGLHHRLAVLVACGNAICGNSAIAAIAPVIGAEAEDIASSIAFTAVLGVLVVLTLPLLIAPLALSHYQYGVVAGLTVYAVPQVLAAALPVSALSAQVGTLVKLVRVLALGPVVIALSLITARRARKEGVAAGTVVPRTRLTPRAMAKLVPWFIIGFLVLAALRSVVAVPAPILDVSKNAANILTVISMAALGLGVDVRVLKKVSGSVTAAAMGALVVLLGMSIGLAMLVHG